jgi:hypothetical protein
MGGKKCTPLSFFPLVLLPPFTLPDFEEPAALTSILLTRDSKEVEGSMQDADVFP